MKMKKFILFFLLSLIATTVFAENFVLINHTRHPNRNEKSKIAIQWATSAKEVDKANQAIVHGIKLKPETLKMINQSGTVTLRIPKKAEYFRILVWINNKGNPDFVTNWVDVLSDKTYTVETKHLIPWRLMSGTGC